MSKSEGESLAKVQLKIGESTTSDPQPIMSKSEFYSDSILILADTQEKQKRRTGCQQLSRRHVLTSSEVSILHLPVKKNPLT